jgi:hypothetical protein
LDFSDFTDAALSDIIDDAEALIERATNDRFYRFTDTIFSDGNGGTSLDLPAHAAFPYKILSLTSVEEVDFDQTTVLTTYAEGVDFRQDGGHYLYVDTNSSPSARTFFSNTRFWPSGQRNIKIVGDFGHDPTPNGIVRATALLSIAWSIGSEFMGLDANAGGTTIKQEQWQDYFVTFGLSEANSERMTSGVPNITGYLEIDRILGQYMNYAGFMSAPPTHV